MLEIQDMISVLRNDCRFEREVLAEKRAGTIEERWKWEYPEGRMPSLMKEHLCQFWITNLLYPRMFSYHTVYNLNEHLWKYFWRLCVFHPILLSCILYLPMITWLAHKALIFSVLGNNSWLSIKLFFQTQVPCAQI